MRFFRRALVGLFLMAADRRPPGACRGHDLVGHADALGRGQRRPTRARTRVQRRGRGADARGRTPVLTAFGEIRSRRTLELRAPAEGQVVELSPVFEDGGAVSAGDVLLRIDPADAEAAACHRAHRPARCRERTDRGRRALELAMEDVAAARRQAELRARVCAANGPSGPGCRQRRRRRGCRTCGSHGGAGGAVAPAGRGAGRSAGDGRRNRAGTVAHRLAEAERRLAETTLTAAFDGVLAEVDVAAGRLVGRNERLAQLIDDTALEVSFRISTAQYARLIGEDGTLPQAPVRVSWMSSAWTSRPRRR
jgi:multidrug efflux pump subunit AcrA (membrane-fusion protein)